MADALRRNIVALLLWQIAGYALPLLTFPYLTRTLGAEQFGTLGFAQAIMAYGVMVTDWGFALTASQEVARNQGNPARLSEILWETMLAKGLLALGSLLVLGLVIVCVPGLRHMAAVLLSSWLLVLGSIMTLNWFLQGMERLDRVVTAELISRLFTVPAIFLFVHKPGDVWIAAAIQGLGAVISGAVSFRAVHKLGVISWRRPSLAGAMAQLKSGRSVFVATAAINVYTTGNSVLLGAISGVREVGFFAGADKLRTAAQSLLSPIGQAAYPRVNALMVEDRDQAFAFLRKLLLLQGGAALLISLGLFVTSSLLIHLALGSGYEESVGILRWLSALPFLIGVSNVFGIQVMMTLGMKTLFTRILLVSGVINVILVVPLSHFYGAYGMAMGMVLVECFVTVVMGIFLYIEKIPLFAFRTAASKPAPVSAVVPEDQ